MFENLGWLEITCLVLLALFIFGPERLPLVVRDAVRFIRKMRNTARTATEDIRAQLGPDVELTDLHPKRLLRKHLLTEDEERELRKPFMDALESSDYRRILEQVRAEERARGTNPPAVTSGTDDSVGEFGAETNRLREGGAPKFDPDAT